MLLLLQLVLGLLQLLLDLLDVLVHLPDGGVQDLPDEESKGATQPFSFSEPWETKRRPGRFGSPGELVSHVLREEPVGHGGAVHDLRPDHFIHQHSDHLEKQTNIKHLHTFT